MMPEQKQQHPLSLRPVDDAVTCDETVVYIIYCRGVLYPIHALHVNNSHPDDPLPQSIRTIQPRDLPQLMGFGCLGSSICMIGGECDWPPPNRGASLDDYILDTHRLPSTTVPLGNPFAYVRKGPRLNAPKLLPIVITHLGKFYALPNLFVSSDTGDYLKPGGEILDPNSDGWAALPEPTIDPSDIKAFSRPCHSKVKSFHDVDSGIVLSLQGGLVYVLDGNNPHDGWKNTSGADWLPELHESWRFGCGSEVVDCLLCPWFWPPPLHHGAHLFAYNPLKQGKGVGKLIPVHQPTPGIPVSAGSWIAGVVRLWSSPMVLVSMLIY